MPKARCPDCDRLVDISPTGQTIEQGKSAQWWLIANHNLVYFDDDPLSYRSRIVVERCGG